MLPTGNGMYMWILDRCTGGNPDAMADLAVRSNLRWVAIKIANGYATFGNQALNQAVVTAFEKRGIPVWGWHYVYGYSPGLEADVAIRQVNSLGLAGYIIDAEAEYKQSGAASAKTYLSQLRKGIREPIGLSSYRFPSLHRDFPWDAFLPRVDFNHVQVYWMGATNAGEQLRRSYNEFQRMAPSLPYLPLGAAFTEHGWTAQSAEVIDFRKTAQDLGLAGYGWWEWYFAETRLPHLWTAATTNLSEPLPPPEDPPAEEPVSEMVATKYGNLRVRSGPSLQDAVLGYMTPFKVHKLVQRSGEWGRLEGDSPRWVHTGFLNQARRVITKYTNLRVRSAPTLNGAVLGYFPANTVTNIVDYSGAWGRLEGPEPRWVHLDYTITL